MTPTAPLPLVHCQSRRRRNASRTWHGSWTIAFAILALASIAFAQQDPPVAIKLGPALPPEYVSFANDWPVATGDLRATRANRHTRIEAASIADLDAAWTFEIGADAPYAGGMTATPVVQGDTVYVQDMASNVFALERSTGAVRWARRFDVPTGGPNGVAVAYGRVYGGLGHAGDVFALDAESGEVLWRVSLTANPGEGIAMAPTVYDSVVYVSTVPGGEGGFHEGGQRGILYALDAGTGDPLWSFDTTAGDPTGNLWGMPRVNSGGGLWSPLSVDGNGSLYFGTANPGPFPGTEDFPNASSRPGPNHYTNSMVSLDPESGGIRWFHAAKPFDLFDLDFHLTPILTDVSYGEADVRLAIGSGKAGVVVAVDADSGGVVWETSVGRHLNDGVTHIPPGRVLRVYPGALGGVETPMALGHGLVFVPVVNLYAEYTATTFLGNQSLFEGTSELVALDVRDGSVRWSVDLPSLSFAGATVANDVVLIGTMDGIVRAFDAATGNAVWSDETRAGLNAPFAVAGDLLLVPSAGPWLVPGETRERVRRLIAYRLP